MYKEIVINRKIFTAIEKGVFTYILLNDKPSLDYVKLISVLKNNSPEIWVRITSVEAFDFRWKCHIVKECPPEKEPEKGFELNVKFDEWY